MNKDFGLMLNLAAAVGAHMRRLIRRCARP
jgi:hypothetical protein